MLHYTYMFDNSTIKTVVIQKSDELLEAIDISQEDILTKCYSLNSRNKIRFKV